MTILFDKNGICSRVMFITRSENSAGLIAWINRNYTKSGENTWVDNQEKPLIKGVLKRNESALTVSAEFVNLIYKPAL